MSTLHLDPDILRAALSLTADTCAAIEREGDEDCQRCRDAATLARNATRAIRALLDDETAQILDEQAGPERDREPHDDPARNDDGFWTGLGGCA